MNGQFEIGGISTTRYFFSIAVLLGLLFAMVSTEQDKAPVLVFLQWQLQAVPPMALMIGAHLLLSKNSRFANFNPWLALVISGVCGATLFVPFALLLDTWFDAEPPGDLGAGLFDEWLGVTPPVVICWLAVNAPWVLGYRIEKKTASAPARAASESGAQPEFMMLLPADKRGRPLLLKSELHYLRVVTENGSALILHNLADAIAQLPPELGLRVHRSYWVALDAIEQLEKRGRQGRLRLDDGSLVPVSRNRLAAVSARLEASSAG